MTDTILTAVNTKKKHMVPGALVRVNIEPGQTNNPAIKCNGMTATIWERFQPWPTAKPQFTLQGVMSDKGKPYWFLEDELILL